MMLGVCRRPYPDELFYGYVYDIFKVNGVTTMGDVDAIIGCGHVRVNSATGLAFICDLIQNSTFPDISEAVAMTPYYAMIDTMTEGEQAKEAERMLFAESPAVPDHSGKIKDEVRICKKCWEEDVKKYGTGYLHLSHHLPGVQVCTKHVCTLEHVRIKSKNCLLQSWDDYDREELWISNLKQAMIIALDAQFAYERNQGVLKSVVCENCGKRYLEHPYSHDTLAGCPFCNQKLSACDILQRRVDARFPDEYEVEPEVQNFHGAWVTHKACGTRNKKIDRIIYGKAMFCRECRTLTPKRLQHQFDPKKEHWLFHENQLSDGKHRRISVTHLDCGRTSQLFMPTFTKKEGGYCPYCNNKIHRIDMTEFDSEYELASDYKNNHERIKLRHKTCGVVFETTKTIFLKGKKCPICSPRLDFDAVVNAVEECTNGGYEITKSKRRGFVNIKRPDGIVLNQIGYRMLIADLKSNCPTIIPDRTKSYVQKTSLRKMVYDSMKEQTEQKGYWCCSDGICGEVVTPNWRNIIQKMVKAGFIKRIGKGKYIIESGCDSDASDDEKDS